MSDQPETDITQRLTNILEHLVDWETRTIYLIGEFTDEKTAKILPVIELLSADILPIFVVLNSPGGEESSGYAIYDMLRCCPAEINIYGLGSICSIAALVFQAGDNRILSPAAQLMMHNGAMTLESAGFVENDKIEQLSSQITKNNTRYHDLIASRSGLDAKQVRGYCKEERFFSAEEAVKLGLADEVATTFETWKRNKLSDKPDDGVKND